MRTFIVFAILLSLFSIAYTIVDEHDAQFKSMVLALLVSIIDNQLCTDKEKNKKQLEK